MQLAIVSVQVIHIHQEPQRPAFRVLLEHVINPREVWPPAMIEVEELAEVSLELQTLL